MISWRNGKDLRERWEDCGSAKTEQKSSLASLTSRLPPRTRLEDKPVMLSGRPGSSKDGLGGNRKVAFGCFLHFQGWQSKLSVVHLTRVQICAAKETDLVMVIVCGKKNTLTCTFCNGNIDFTIWWKALTETVAWHHTVKIIVMKIMAIALLTWYWG